MPVATLPSSPAVERRHKALKRHLHELRGFFSEPRAPGVSPLSISTPSGEIPLDPWVHDQLDRAFAHDGPPAGYPALLAQCVALLMKFASDRLNLERGSNDDEQKLYGLEAQLMLDLGIAMALCRELQQAVDEAVREGDVRLAKQLTRFRHEVRKTVSDAKTVIAEAEQRRAHALSDVLTDAPRNDEFTAGDAELQRLAWKAGSDHEKAKSEEARRRERRLAMWLPSRTEALVTLLGILVVAWVGLTSMPGLIDDGIPEVTAGDLLPSGAIRSLEARPPSLYVTVEPTAWLLLGAEKKRRIVAGISSVLLTNGYTGALLTTPDGRPVAQWLSQRGVELIDTDERNFASTQGSVTLVE